VTQQQPAIGVLGLQGDVAEHLRALGESGVRASLVRRPGELEAVDGLIIPGGESTTIWKLAEIFELAEPLRKRVAGGMPAFGSSAIAGPPYRAVFIRAPWVSQAGPACEILATDPATGRIVAVRQGPVLATAFHPELTGDRRIHELFVNMVRERS
jgi:5'-phosphate synthase pdxT subunit